MSGIAGKAKRQALAAERNAAFHGRLRALPPVTRIEIADERD
jgi:hypothetical protein